MTKRKKSLNKQLAEGLADDFTERFINLLNIDEVQTLEKISEYIKSKIPLEKPISERKYNRIMNKTANKFGKRLFKSLSKEDKNRLSALRKEFGKDKLEIIKKYQKSKEYWVDGLPNDPEE